MSDGKILIYCFVCVLVLLKKNRPGTSDGTNQMMFYFLTLNTLWYAISVKIFAVKIDMCHLRQFVLLVLHLVKLVRLINESAE